MLEETLWSLKQQSYPHLEILLLDNACPLLAQQILQSFADQDPRVRVLRSEQRLPMFENFNRGVRAATGGFIVFFFDDDVYLPRFIELTLAMLVAHPRAGFVGSNYFIIDEAGRETALRRLVKKTKVVPGRDYIKGLIWRGRNVIATPGLMYRRELITACPFDESLSVHFGDFVMLMRMAEVADVALMSAPLMQMRIHRMAESSSLPPSQAVPLRTSLLCDYIAEYTQRWPDDQAYVNSLARGLDRSHIVGLFSGWISAGEDAEAEKCLVGLQSSTTGRRLSTCLRLIDRLGLSSRKRQALLAPLLQRLGRIIPA